MHKYYAISHSIKEYNKIYKEEIIKKKVENYNSFSIPVNTIIDINGQYGTLKRFEKEFFNFAMSNSSCLAVYLKISSNSELEQLKTHETIRYNDYKICIQKHSCYIDNITNEEVECYIWNIFGIVEKPCYF